MNLLADTNALKTKAMELNLACICYVFDPGLDGEGTGFALKADMGDALVAIRRIVKQFGIVPGALVEVLGIPYLEPEGRV